MITNLSTTLTPTTENNNPPLNWARTATGLIHIPTRTSFIRMHANNFVVFDSYVYWSDVKQRKTDIRNNISVKGRYVQIKTLKNKRMKLFCWRWHNVPLQQFQQLPGVDVFSCFCACAYSATSWPSITQHTMMKSLLCIDKSLTLNLKLLFSQLQWYGLLE